MKPPVSKLPDVGTSIFTVMSRLAVEHGAVNLSQGSPDFDCDPALVDAAAEAMRAGRNQYALMAGATALREALAGKAAACYGAAVDPESDIQVTCGATEALFSTFMAFVRPGDEVIVFEPCYDSYVPAIRLAGGTPRFVPLRYPDYAVDWDAVRRAMSPKTRAILINTPHNPTGTIWSAGDMAALASLVDGTDVLLVSDEVYEHIVFDGARHESLLRYPDLRSRAVVISSFGKTYHATGWKVGYAIGPAALIAEVRRVHQFVTFSVHPAAQAAFAEFVQRDPQVSSLTPFYQAKRDLFRGLLEGTPFRPLPCRGTYFQLADYSAWSSEKDTDAALRLLHAHGVASIPCSPFNYEGSTGPVLRFCFAKQDDTLRAAAERLRQA